MKKPLKFYVHQLVVDSASTFDCSTFSPIKESDTETFEIGVKEEEKETLSVKKVVKKNYEDRFLTLYFHEGDKYPYPPKVMGSDLQEKDNPRAADLIELDDQLFVLIDTMTKRLWISDQRKKNTITTWMKDKLRKDVVIKSIIRDGEFMDKIKSVQEISFSVVPDLFNSSVQDTLSNHLVQDIFGFGAERAKIQLLYNNSQISDKIKKKFLELIGRKSEFQGITVIGRSDEDLESTFNLQEIVSKVSIDVNADSTSKLLEPDEVFASLISKIKQI